MSSFSSDTGRLEEFKWGFWEQICCAVCCPDKTGRLADFLSWFCWCCDRTERVMRDRFPIGFRMELIERFGSAIKAVPEKHSLFHALAHGALQGRYEVRVDDASYASGQEDKLAQALIAQFSSLAEPKDKTDSRKETIQGQSEIVAFCKAHEVHVSLLYEGPTGKVQERLLPHRASYRRTLYLITDGKDYFAPFEYGGGTAHQIYVPQASVDTPCMMQMAPTISQRNLQDTNFLAWITRETGLYYRDVDTDGNCQFRAVAQQLGQITDAGLLGEGLPTLSEDDHAAVLREQAVKWLRDNRAHERVAPVLAGDSDYLENMAKDKCWGDELTAFALSQHLGMCIVTLTPYMQTSTGILLHHVHKPEGLTDIIEAAGVIVLVYNGTSHYGSITARPGMAFAHFCTLRGVSMQCSVSTLEEAKRDGSPSPSGEEGDPLLGGP